MLQVSLSKFEPTGGLAASRRPQIAGQLSMRFMRTSREKSVQSCDLSRWLFCSESEMDLLSL